MSNIFVDDICLQTYPCQHYVTIDGISKCLFSTEIYELLINNIKNNKELKIHKDYLDHFRDNEQIVDYLVDDEGYIYYN